MSESTFPSDHQANSAVFGEQNAQPRVGQVASAPAELDSEEIHIGNPEFAPLQDSCQAAVDTSLDRFFDVTVT